MVKEWYEFVILFATAASPAIALLAFVHSRLRTLRTDVITKLDNVIIELRVINNRVGKLEQWKTDHDGYVKNLHHDIRDLRESLAECVKK